LGQRIDMRVDLLLKADRWRNLANTVLDENVRALILREAKKLEQAAHLQEQAERWEQATQEGGEA